MNEYPKISGNAELRMAYSFLSLAVETALPIDFIVAVKRAIRKYNHRQTDYGIRAIWSDGESCVYLVALPETIDSREGAKSYFEDVEYRRPSTPPTTAQAWHLPPGIGSSSGRGRWYAYHCMCLDV